MKPKVCNFARNLIETFFFLDGIRYYFFGKFLPNIAGANVGS